MNNILSYLLKEYDQENTEIFLKAKLILITMLFVILSLIAILFYTTYLVGVINSIIIIEATGLTVMLFALTLLIRGKYTTAIHLILVSGFATAWGTIFIGPGDSIFTKTDTIVFIVGLLAAMPLFFFKNRKPMIGYFLVNLFLFFLFVLHLHRTTSLTTKELMDYFFDNLLVMTFVFFISYSLFSIYKQVLNSLKIELDEKKHSENINKTLFAISNAVNTTLNLNALYKQTHSLLSEIIDVTNFFIAIVSDDNRTLQFPYFVDTVDDDYSPIKKFDPQKSLTGLVVSAQKPVLLKHDRLNALSERNGVCGPTPLVWMGVPLIKQGKVFGVIAVQSYTDPALYNEQDLKILSSFSDQIAIAIDRKRKEDDVRKSEHKFRTAFKTSPHIITLTSFGDDIYVDINDAFTKLLGYTPDEVIGKTSTEVNIWNDFKNRERLRDELKKQGFVENLHADFTGKDGQIVNVAISARTVEMGESRHLLAVAQDLTEFKRNEQERLDLEIRLQQAQKMEAIGTLAGGIAHDFNNILAGIFGYSQLALNQLDKPDKVKNYIIQIDKGSKRAAGLVRQILTFSRQDEYQKYPLKISSAVKEALLLLRSSIPVSIEIDKKINSNAVILADPTKIHQLLINLCTNAYHAIGDGNGTITISLTDKKIQKPQKTNRVPIPPGNYLELKVSDTGTGIDKTVLKKIFDPYFTTKQIGRGTGLGLALVKAIVKEHDGYISVISAPGQGAAFHIYFPVFEKKADLSPAGPMKTRNLNGNEKIMIVDDEAAIRDISEKILKNHGYDVTVFKNGPEAFADFEKDPCKYDLVLTDMTMPKISGDKLAVEMIKKNPDVRVILCTGFSETLSKEHADRIGIKKILNKPLTMDNLLRNIREVLDQK